MKIEITHYEEKHSSEFADENTIDEVMEKVRNLLVLVGFHIDSINGWIVEEADELNINNK